MADCNRKYGVDSQSLSRLSKICFVTLLTRQTSLQSLHLTMRAQCRSSNCSQFDWQALQQGPGGGECSFGSPRAGKEGKPSSCNPHVGLYIGRLAQARAYPCPYLYIEHVWPHHQFPPQVQSAIKNILHFFLECNFLMPHT